METTPWQSNNSSSTIADVRKEKATWKGWHDDDNIRKSWSAIDSMQMGAE